ncbi:MAG: ABC transporter ATP-binding protein [Burkholderiales bacterium]
MAYLASQGADGICIMRHYFHRILDDAPALFHGFIHLFLHNHAYWYPDVYSGFEISRVTSMAEIKILNLRKEFSDFVAVRESNFTVNNGEFFCLLGPSGCGKTTTLRMIAGLELPTAGQIFLDKEDVTFKRASQRDIAFVFQLFALYPHMNVYNNIAFPLVAQGYKKSEIQKKIHEAASILKIEHLLRQSVSGLSSGDRQRVALGRAIVRQPSAFMMDEPLGALDSEFRESMCQELRALHDRLGATTVYVTHDQLEAMSMADKMAVMNKGVVEQLGTPQDIYDNPATLFVADFIGSPPMNFLTFEAGLNPGDNQAMVENVLTDIPSVIESVPEQTLVLGVRPEHIRISPDSNFRVEVLGAEYLGIKQIVTCKTVSGKILRINAPSNAVLKRGEHLGLTFNVARASLFSHSTGHALPVRRLGYHD